MPHTLNCYEVQLMDGNPRYENWAAVEAHESSDNYKTFFKTMTDEELLAVPPTITKAEYVHSFKR